jgi:formate dehydrogenase iron-sulfur subunit
MLDEKTLQIKSISAHPGNIPGKGVQREFEVCKLMDTTSCIGCKACEVACVEWNGMPFQETKFDNTYQTMPETDWNFWQLIKFAEVKRNLDGSLSPFASKTDSDGLMWIFRKDQCMHCADPGCLRACPADGAIVQYSNGIVDFQQDYCIGCQLCVSGCPFNIPKFNQTTKKVYKCTLCSDRVGNGLEPACIKACPTGCLQFGTKQEMKEVAEKRATQLRDNFGFSKAGVWDPESVGGTHVMYVLHDAEQPELYGGLPAKPEIPLSYTIWKGIFKPVLEIFALLGAVGVLFHYVTFGPMRPQPEPPIKQEPEGKER